MQTPSAPSGSKFGEHVVDVDRGWRADRCRNHTHRAIIATQISRVAWHCRRYVGGEAADRVTHNRPLATGRVPPRNCSSAERSGGPTPYRDDRRRSPQRLAGGTLVGCFRPQRSRSVSSWIGNSVRAQPTCGQAPRAVLRNPVLLSTVVRTTPVTLRPWSDPEVRRRGERWLQDVALRTSRTRQSWKGWSDPRDERHR